MMPPLPDACMAPCWEARPAIMDLVAQRSKTGIAAMWAGGRSARRGGQRRPVWRPTAANLTLMEHPALTSQPARRPRRPISLPRVARPLSMKKEGIQTRNRKLSSKSKKKKGMLGFPDMLKPLDKGGFGGFGTGGSGFGSMSHYMYGGQMHGSSMAGGFMSAPPMHGMSAMSGGLGSLGLSSAAAASAASLGLSSGFCTVAA
ncbi:GATA-binding factor C [Portunus trituberculatus]|uniref:GATA-binding factor C n=1 Tax=Portunus trituberculatus TaxID=210409 RepID=A0A5B7EB07_PORTR|nr:GATA-binding factor C [Portunus trituberculatus]